MDNSDPGSDNNGISNVSGIKFLNVVMHIRVNANKNPQKPYTQYNILFLLAFCVISIHEIITIGIKIIVMILSNIISNNKIPQDRLAYF